MGVLRGFWKYGQAGRAWACPSPAASAAGASSRRERAPLRLSREGLREETFLWSMKYKTNIDNKRGFGGLRVRVF